MTTLSRLRVAIAGLGTMGRNHLRHLVLRDDVVLTSIADPVVTLQQVAAHGGTAVRAYASPLDLLHDEPLDALIVAAPTTLHYSVALAALERGIAVLVEKPLAASLEEGRDLVQRAARSGLILQVGHVERFNPAVLALRQRLQDGALSRIFSIRTVRGGPLPARVRDVGVAIDLATHDVDIICNLLGERPSRAYAEMTRHVHTDHEDLLYGLMAFPSGVIAHLDVNWLTPEKQRWITVLGEEGMFHVDLLAQSLTFTRGTSDLQATYLDGYAPTFAGETVSLPVTSAEPLGLELDAFFSAVRTGVPSPVTAEQGLWALMLANLLLDSARSHLPVAVEAPVYL